MDASEACFNLDGHMIGGLHGDLGMMRACKVRRKAARIVESAGSMALTDRPARALRA